jgi:membrane protein
VRGRVTGIAERASSRTEELRRKAEARIAEEEPSSRKGVAIEWFARYRAADGGLYSLLVAAFLFITFVPAMVVISTYVSSDPDLVATRLIERLNLSGATARLVRDVLSGAGIEKLIATLIAVISVIIFGTGIGRTLQIVYARVWRLRELQAGFVENLRYLVWLSALVVGGGLYAIEIALLRRADDWVEWVTAPFWILGIVAFLTWTPVFLLHRQVTWRDALPGAVATTVGLAGIRLLSSIIFTNWLNWYAEYYGGIGIAIAALFWLALITSVFIAGAAFAPAYLAHRGARVVPPAQEAGS